MQMARRIRKGTQVIISVAVVKKPVDRRHPHMVQTATNICGETLCFNMVLGHMAVLVIPNHYFCLTV